MPLTFQFGSWAPDQADTAVEFQDQQGPITVPCADVLNVYYANGSYRNIASPSNATIDGFPVALLATQAVNAFSYFDTVQAQETVFVGTSVGVQQLNADGTWAIINIVSSSSTTLLGQAMAITAQNFLNTNTLRGQSLTITAGIAGANIGNTSFVSGRFTISLEFPKELLVGVSAPPYLCGTVIHSALPNAGVLNQLTDLRSDALFVNSCFAFATSVDPGKTFFTTITVGGTSYQSANSQYTYDGAIAQWIWTIGNGFGLSPGATYSIFLT